MKTRTNWTLAGGIVAAVGASLCCVTPLALLSIGVSGAWIASLTALEPFRPFFIAATALAFGFAGWQLFKPEADCEPNYACALPAVRLRRKAIFIITAFIAVMLITSPYWIPFVAA